jgi:phosphonate transport system substrate-binding protein
MLIGQRLRWIWKKILTTPPEALRTELQGALEETRTKRHRYAANRQVAEQDDKLAISLSMTAQRFDYLTIFDELMEGRLDMSHVRLMLFVLVTSAFAVACDFGSPPPSGPQYESGPGSTAKYRYYLAIHPLHNPKKLAEADQPLVDYLSANIPEADFILEASRDYQDYERKFRARTPEFLLPNPWHTLEAIKVGYHVIAMAGDADDFKGIFIVRKDSDLQTPADLKGEVVSYPSHTALAACIMPQYFLYQNGVDINQDIENIYVGSQESSIMNAYLGKSAAGATWPPPWRLFQKDHPDQAAELKLIWETKPLMNNSFMARDDVPVALRDKVQKLIVELDQTPEGQAILESSTTAAFHMADDASYNRVRDYVATFEQQVRPVEQK